MVLGVQVLINLIIFFEFLIAIKDTISELKNSIYGMGVELSNQNSDNFKEVFDMIKTIPKEITVKNVLKLP